VPREQLSVTLLSVLALEFKALIGLGFDLGGYVLGLGFLTS